MDRSYWEQRGFDFVAIRDLQTARERQGHIPKDKGVYLVLLEACGSPPLRDANAHAQWTRSTKELMTFWVPGEPTLYIGKAGARRSGLRGRISALIRFSQNGTASHRGGYRLWQVNDHSNYLVGWQLDGDPGWGEYELVDAFRTKHAGRQPFANIETVNPPKRDRLAPRPTQHISLHDGSGLKRGEF